MASIKEPNVYLLFEKKFLKFCAVVLHIKCPPYVYTPVLRILDLKSLADRKVHNNILFLPKLIKSYTYAPMLLGNINFLVPPRLSEPSP